MTRTVKLGDAPMIMKVNADQTMQPVWISPQWSFSMSTRGPPPRFTTAEPACLTEKRAATRRSLYPSTSAMFRRIRGNPRSYRWEIPWPKDMLPSTKPRFCRNPARASTA